MFYGVHAIVVLHSLFVPSTRATHEIVLHIITHAILKRGKWLGISALAAKLVHVGLREVLVLPSQGLGHFDVFDLRALAHGSKNSIGQIVPAARFAGAAIEQTADVAMVQRKMQRDINRVAHVNEIALLLAVAAVALVALEQFDAAR